MNPIAKEIVKVKNFNNDKYNLIIGINTLVSNVEAIILSGHIDTVCESENVPYRRGEVVDGRMYGLGIIDMKCFFASILDNIEEISKIKTPIILAITDDEETELMGILEVIKELKNRGVKNKLTIVGEPTMGDICTECNGCYEYNVRIKGKSAHSSKPKEGVNANFIMAKIINKIEKLSNIKKGITLNVGISNGGNRINIVPEEAQLFFDIRTNKNLLKEKVLSKINKYLKRIELLYSGSSMEIINTLTIPCLEKYGNRITNKIIKEMGFCEYKFPAGCEASYFKELGGESFIFGVGDLNLAHNINESLELDKYFEYNTKLLKILQDLDSGCF